MEAFGNIVVDSTTHLGSLAVVPFAGRFHLTLLCDRGVTFQLRFYLIMIANDGIKPPPEDF